MGDSSVGKVLAIKEWGPEFDTQQPGEKQDVMVLIYSLSAEEAETGGYFRFTGQLILQNAQASWSSERHCLKK